MLFPPSSSRPGMGLLEGHVAEWLWYLLMREHADDARKIVLLEPPKFSVTEPGPGGRLGP